MRILAIKKLFQWKRWHGHWCWDEFWELWRSPTWDDWTRGRCKRIKEKDMPLSESKLSDKQLAAKYKQQRDVLYNCWLESWKNSNDLADVIKEMTLDEGYDIPVNIPWRENATSRK